MYGLGVIAFIQHCFCLHFPCLRSCSLLHIRVLTQRWLCRFSTVLGFFFKYIWSQHAGLVFISTKPYQGEGEMEPVLCQRLHLWVEGAPCWSCVSASQCKHEFSFDRMHHILPAGLCLLIRLIFTFGLMVQFPLGDTCFNLDQIKIMQSEVLDAPRVNSCFD